jgi:peptidoglycan/LPS O-acetylase OafA/YrhL
LTSNKDHLPYLDGIRGIAILSVFLFHALGMAYGMEELPWDGLLRNFDAPTSFLALYPLTYGRMGVAIFFALSGFCIYLSYQRSWDKSWLCFFNRRFFRIYPAYLLAVLVFFFVWPWGKLQLQSYDRLYQLVMHVFAIHNFDTKTIWGINASFWSIAIEIQLYAIYPLLVLFTRKFGWKNSLLICLAGEILIRSSGFFFNSVFETSTPRFLKSSPFAYWFSWAIGAYLADCYLRKAPCFLAKIPFGFAALAALSFPLFRPTAPYTFAAFALLTAVGIERLLSDRWKFSVPSLFGKAWSHLSFLGIVSYSFYLIHQPLLSLTKRLLTTMQPGFQASGLSLFMASLIWYPVVLLLSWVCYKAEEQPSIALGKVVWTAIRSRRPVAI